jgi:Lipocalin-like domain
MKKIAFILMAGIVVFSACKKKKDDVPATCELTAAGITGSYKATKIEVNAGTGYLDFTNNLLEACEKDDTYNFNANGAFTYSDAGTACSPNGSGTGTWSVAAGKLTLSASGTGYDFSGAALSDNKCTSFVVTDASQGVRVTFTK